MIKTLRLGRFGKFEGASFDFEGVTVFYGENESGKSTIFDALVDGLCAPPGSVQKGREIAQRYGAARRVEVEPAPDPAENPWQRFKEFQAFTAKSLDLPIGDDKAWIDKVKANLFSGGMDPDSFIRELSAMLTENRTLRFQKELDAANKKEAAAEGELGALKEQRRALLGSELEVKGGRERLSALEAALSAKKAALGRERADRDAQAALGELAAHRETARDLELARRMAEEAPRLRALVESREAEEAAAAREEALRAREIAAAAANDAMSRASELRAEREAARAQLAAAERAAAVARDIRSKLEAAGREKEEGGFKPGFLAGFGTVAIALVVAALVALSPPFSYAAIGLAVFVALAGILLARGRSAAAPRSDAVQEARREWAERAGGTQLPGDDAFQILSELGKHLAREEQARAALESASARSAASESALAAAEERAKRAGAAAAAAEARLNAALAASGASSLAEQRERRAEAQARLQRKAELDRRLGELAGRQKLRDAEALLAETDRRIRELEPRATGPAETEDERRARDRRVAALEAEIAALGEERTRLTAQVSKGEGRVSGSLGTLPEEIAARELALEEARAAAGALLARRRAARIAVEILEGMKSDSGGVLDSLAREISAAYSGLVGAERTAGVGGLAIDKDRANAEAQDRSGEARALGSLSQGTRDAFMLAARLCLARRSGAGAGSVLLFDDAFLSFDEQRAAQALALLAEERERSKWQLVFLTKDRRFAELARERFPGAAFHELRIDSPRRG